MPQTVRAGELRFARAFSRARSRAAGVGPGNSTQGVRREETEHVHRHVVVALAVVGFVLLVASAGVAGGKLDGLNRVSRDDIVDGMGFHQSEMQPSLAADGTKKTLVGAFEVGRIFNGGSSAIGFAVSTDAGKAWKDGLLPLTVGEQADDDGRSARSGGRPTRPRHTTLDGQAWLISSTGLNGTGGRSASSSTGRRTATSGRHRSRRTPPAPATRRRTARSPATTAPASQGYGNCYLAYNNAGSTPANQLSGRQRRPTAARTWSAPVGAADASIGTGAVTLVQPPPPGAAPGTTCGRVVVAFTNGTTASTRSSRPTAAPRVGAHPWSRPTLDRHAHRGPGPAHVARRCPARPTAPAALYLAWQTRSFRIQQTTLAAAANAGDTNIKVASVTGMVAGNTLTVDAAAPTRRR